MDCIDLGVARSRTGLSDFHFHRLSKFEVYSTVLFSSVQSLSHVQFFATPFNFSFFSVTGWDIDLGYCDIEWFALETNRDHSIVFEIASKDCILDSLVDHDGYSISSKGFLPTG